MPRRKDNLARIASTGFLTECTRAKNEVGAVGRMALSERTVSYYSITPYDVIFIGSAAQRGLWPPRLRGSLITHNDAPQSVGLLWDE
jgi:hypothetical protein